MVARAFVLGPASQCTCTCTCTCIRNASRIMMQSISALIVTSKCCHMGYRHSQYNSIKQLQTHSIPIYTAAKSLPRTVNQILHLPSSLRSKNSLHGLWWGGFWIATPLPASQTPPRLGTCRVYEMPKKNQAAFSEGSREPAISRRTRMQKVSTYHYPTIVFFLQQPNQRAYFSLE